MDPITFNSATTDLKNKANLLKQDVKYVVCLFLLLLLMILFLKS